MTTVVLNRRNLLVAGGSVLATGVSGLLLPARAEGLAATATMPGGANNYRKGAAIVDRIGKGGFWMSGTVRRAGDGAPYSDAASSWFAGDTGRALAGKAPRVNVAAATAAATLRKRPGPMRTPLRGE